MTKTKKGILISVCTPALWLMFAVVFPNFQKYKEPDFNRNLQLVSYSISFILFILFIYGIFQILTGIRESRKR